MSKVHYMKSSTTGAAFRYARAQSKTLNVPYVQLWTGVLVLLLSVVLVMHPLNVWGYGWYNVFPFILTIIVVMFMGLMPFWLVLAALVGGGYQASKWNNPLGGAVTGVDFWARKVVASALTAYAFLALPLIFIPMGNFPMAYYGYAIGVVVIFFAGLAYGKPMGFGYKVIVGMVLAMIAVGGFLATPSSVKEWVEDTVTGSSAATNSTASYTPHKPMECDTVVEFKLTKKQPYMMLNQEKGNLALGCNISFQRGQGPAAKFRIDGGEWMSYKYSEGGARDLPPIGKSLEFKLADTKGEVFIRVSNPAY